MGQIELDHRLLNYISQALPIGHSDDKDVVELVDAVNLGEQLVDNGVIHPRTLSPA